MKVAVFNPYGDSSPESALMYVLARAHRSSHLFEQLRCNGAFSTCERDAASGWRRAIGSCSTCTLEQRKRGEWGSCETKEISVWVQPLEIERIQSWVRSQPVAELVRAEFEGLPIASLLEGHLKLRFGDAGTLDLVRHEALLRRLVRDGLVMVLAATRYLTTSSPDLVLVAGSRDFMGRALLFAARESRIRCALFQWRPETASTDVVDLEGGSVLCCNFKLGDLASLRTNLRSWPTELLQTVQSLTDFLSLDAAPARASHAG